MRWEEKIRYFSIEGAHTLGHILSATQTTRQNGLNSSKYIQYLFEEWPSLPELAADKLDAYLQKFRQYANK